MRLGIFTSLIIACISCPTIASTLRLSPEINLLVLDGKKVSSSLFKGSNGVTLTKGEHQILFRIEKTVSIGTRNEELFRSPPIIIKFSADDSASISIVPARITTKAEALRFLKKPTIRLVNENSITIPNTQDILGLQGFLLGTQYEKEMLNYNLSNKPASMPIFTDLAYPDQATKSYPTSPSNRQKKKPVIKGDTAEEEMLQYWFHRADIKTRQRFLAWAKQQ